MTTTTKQQTLEALQAMVREYDDEVRWIIGDEPEPEEITAARAAIANARLIAAAPEMLEALSRCKNELEELSFYLEAQCIFGTWKATIEKARAAIAKATGEPQI